MSDADYNPETTSAQAIDQPKGEAEGEYKSGGASDVINDDAPVDGGVDPATADSDETLQKDDNEAIDQDNIVDGRTRGAKPSGGYREPGDEEGIPTDD